MKKAGLLFATVVMLLLFTFSANALESTGQCGDNVYWFFDESTGELVISGEGEMWDYDDHYGSFVSPFDSSDIQSVVIEDSVTHVGDNVFESCYSLVNINVDKENSYYSSEDGVLFNKTKTKLVFYPRGNKKDLYEIPDGVTEIGEYAFRWCKVEMVTIPGSVTTICYGAFYYSSVRDAVIEEGVKVIGDEAFQGCGNIWITLPDSVVSIENESFPWQAVIYCNRESYAASYVAEKNLNHVFINDAEGNIFTGTVGNITWKVDKILGTLEIYGIGDMPDFSYGNKAPWHEYRSYLKFVTLSEDITSIGSEAFSGFNRVTNIVIPENVTVIGQNAFYGSGITSINIPSSVKHIGGNAFLECFSLEEVFITDLAAWCAIRFADEYSNPLCLWDTSLYINNILAKDLIIPDEVTVIDNYAFCGYRYIQSVKIHAGVTKIGDLAFAACYSLENIIVDEKNKYYSSDEYGVLFNKDKSKLIQYPIGMGDLFEKKSDYEHLKYLAENITEYTVPDTVKIIGEYAFAGCYLTEIHIPEGVTTIGDYALSTIAPLSLTIPDSVTRIGEGFCNSGNILTMELGKGITYVGEAGSLRAVIIPDTVTEIVWGYNDEIEEVFYEGTEEQWNKITMHMQDNVNWENTKIHYNYSCDAHEYSEEVIEEDSLGDVSIEYKKYTCSKCGWYRCKMVGKVKDHTMTDWSVDVPATCTEEGTEIRSCINAEYCGYTETRVAPVTAHPYTSVVTPPTCTEKGYTTYTCSCGDTYIADYVGAKAHSYSSVVTRPATHLAAGIRTHTCSKCGDSYTETIAKTSQHTYISSCVVAPGCESEGYTVYACECGDNYNGDKKAPTGHSYGENNICSVCGESKADNCSCNCHKGGISGLIWKILRIFYKLFGMNKVCSCGIAHY